MFGLTQGEYDFICNAVVLPLERCGARVYCFGSRARDNHSKFSDLDLMVEAERDLSGAVEDIRERLTGSNFPYKVDLVEYRQYAESYKPGYLRDRVPFRI